MRASIVGLSFSTAPHHARYVPFAGGVAPVAVGSNGGFAFESEPEAAAGSTRAPRWMRCARCSRTRPCRKIGHDLKFDAMVLARHGVNLQGLETDTMIASYLVDANRSSHPIEDLALEHTGYKALTEEDVCGRGAKAVSFAQIPVQAALDYAGERSDLALQLARAAARDPGAGRSRGALRGDGASAAAGADGDRARRHPHRRTGARLAGAAHRRGALQAGAPHLRAVGRGIQHQLAEEARRDPVRQDGADDGDAEADVEDQGALDSVRGARRSWARSTSCRGWCSSGAA